jgi:hypothetical protein
MSATSMKSTQMNSRNTPNAIFSPESEAGAMLSDSQDGQMKHQSGPAPVPVSRFRALEKDKDTPMKDTFGPLFTASSPSADLQYALASKLRALMDVNGSPEFELTWKTWDMPSGLPICALRASERRTEDNAYSGWPTCAARDWKSGKSNQHGKNARPLNEVVSLVSWPTPNTMSGGQTSRGGDRKDEKLMGGLVGWTTPCQTDAKCGSQYTENMTGKDLAKDATLAGPNQQPSSAGTENSGAYRLNPFFSLNLMGYPVSWAMAGIRSYLKSRKQ